MRSSFFDPSGPSPMQGTGMLNWDWARRNTQYRPIPNMMNNAKYANIQFGYSI
jgi:hypothetical protein